MELLAFIAFAALVIAWLAAPTGRPAASEPAGPLVASEAGA
ncbi:MAG TPA: hypothetical protein VFQ80_18105 [Thermomicrobiales bacterium]|jgi:hypothetical protein|nr:hypothetical protein [Thermomicrobiales bacterium]